MSDCGIDDVMKKIKSKYSDEQMKQAAATFLNSRRLCLE